MDLYADLPLAKGAKTSSALDANGNPKTSLPSTSSVWASAPLMVPQAAKAKSTKNSQSTAVSSTVTNSTLIPPNAFPAERGKHIARSSMSLSFHPTSMARKTSTGATRVVQKKEKQEKAQITEIALGYVAATEVKVTLVQQQKAGQPQMQQQFEENGQETDVGVNATEGHFFQAMYRDEYQPSRPNSYEVYCKERKEKKKLDQVKRELSRRQREQEREGKLEREKLAKDLAEGRAPAMELSASAGRGRSMTMPAWMRKKIEENAASQPESERDVDRERELKKTDVDTTKGQFEDATETQGGLGYSTEGNGLSSLLTSPSSALSDEASRAAIAKQNVQPFGSSSSGGDCDSRIRRSTDHHHARVAIMDKFGREIRHDSSRGNEDQFIDNHGEHSTRFQSNNSHDSGLCQGSKSNVSGGKRRRTSGWDSKSPHTPLLTSRVVLLKNMVGPGEVDDELQDEVKGECSEKYGSVAKCVIYEVTGRVLPEEAVRIFVQFTNPDDATKGLHGRFFGGRKVKAVYYDESKFERMDLTSQ